MKTRQCWVATTNRHSERYACYDEKVTTYFQLVKKFPAFYGIRRFITTLTSARHLSLSWASSIQSISPHPTFWRFILILSSHLRLGLPSGLFSYRMYTFRIRIRCCDLSRYCRLSLRSIKHNLFIALADTEVSFHSFVTSTPDGCECSSARHGHSASGALWEGDWASPELSRCNSTL
jgi:hypothetical protein